MSALDIAKGIGYLTVKEVNEIKRIASMLPADPIAVNIGSGAGTSVIAVLEERSDVMLFDVDLDLSHGRTQLIEEGYFADARLHRIEGDSSDVGERFPATVDYLFVDGDHVMPGVQRDCAAWLPKMRPGGFVLFHDYWPYPADHELAGVNYWPDVKAVADVAMQGALVVADVDRIRVYQV